MDGKLRRKQLFGTTVVLYESWLSRNRHLQPQQGRIVDFLVPVNTGTGIVYIFPAGGAKKCLSLILIARFSGLTTAWFITGLPRTIGIFLALKRLQMVLQVKVF